MTVTQQTAPSWAGDKVLRHRRINVVAEVVGHAGLIVPVIRDTDPQEPRRDRDGDSRACRPCLSRPADPGGVHLRNVHHSNLRMFGVNHVTAVIDPAEAAILAVGGATG